MPTPRRKDQLVDLFVGRVDVGRHDALVARQLQHAFAVDPGAVILDHDQDIAAGLFGRQAHRADFALAAGEALFGGFDAVIG
jgi:hypothetical protein